VLRVWGTLLLTFLLLSGQVALSQAPKIWRSETCYGGTAQPEISGCRPRQQS
jgi:hypothetical protein